MYTKQYYHDNANNAVIITKGLGKIRVYTDQVCYTYLSLFDIRTLCKKITRTEAIEIAGWKVKKPMSQLLKLRTE